MVKLTKKQKLLVIVFLQLLFLTAVAAGRLIILTTGVPVVLKTRPVDPRDLMMGDYVNLSYEISELDLNSLREDRDFNADIKRNQTVYLVLRPEGGYYVPDRVSVTKPRRIEPGMVMIRGKYLYGYQSAPNRSAGIAADTAVVLYGIERFYVPEGRGREIENAPPQALKVQVRVSARGDAVLEQILINDQPLSVN